tara:strand:- start:1228 stop:2781 length:1554 start_codon:yes stop_codon:yes gene_type:complete
MRKKFENYKELDLNLIILDSKSLSALVDHLYKKLRCDHKNVEKKKNHLKIIIANLYNNYSIDKKRYTGIYRSSNRYNSNSRYNGNHISRGLIDMVKLLSDNGYMQYYNGVNARNSSATSYISRNKLTDKLLYLIKKYKINESDIELLPNTECIIVQIKDENGKRKVEYTDTENIKRYRSILTDYNNLLRETHIDINELPAKNGIIIGKSKNPVVITQSEKFVRRIFNHEGLDIGGRYYGGWWQRLNSEWRNKININNAPTVEIDYSGVHLRILYDQHGLSVPPGDVYDLREMGYREIYRQYSDDEIRPVLKVLLLIMLNADSEKKAIRAFRYELQDKDNNYPSDLNISTLISKFSQLHYRLRDKKLFYTGVGKQLARQDSDIATGVIEYFTKKRIAVLTIHDSFIIDFKHLAELKSVMIEQYKKIVKPEADVKVKYPFIVKYRQMWDEIRKPYTFSKGRKVTPISNIVVPYHMGTGNEVIYKNQPQNNEHQKRYEQFINDKSRIKDYYRHEDLRKEG